MERWQKCREFCCEFSSQQVGIRAISQKTHLSSPEFSSEISVLRWLGFFLRGTFKKFSISKAKERSESELSKLHSSDLLPSAA